MNTPESESSSPQSSGLQVEFGAKPTRHLKKIWLVPLLVLLAIVTGGVVWLWAQGPQPAFGLPVASPPNFVFNTPTTVTFTILIDTPTLNPTTVELLRVNAGGNLIASAGRMYDNGQNGDMKPGDKVFTARLILNEGSIGKIYFRVAAAFRGNSQNARSGLVSVDVDPFPLPPDPGEAGKQTLQGVDSDNDGVRDDVQRWIALTFLSSQKTQLALRDATMATQNLLLAVDSTSAQTATEQELAAARCLGFLHGASNAYTIASRLDDQVLNTELRKDAYRSSQRKIDVGTLSSARQSELRNFCSFNPDSLPN